MLMIFPYPRSAMCFPKTLLPQLDWPHRPHSRHNTRARVSLSSATSTSNWYDDVLDRALARTSTRRIP